MLSIVIPVHNGRLSIAKTLDAYVGYFSTECGHPFEILVVPNGCTDGTCQVLEEYTARFPQVVTREFDAKLGKGGAVIEGFRATRGEVLAFVDADGATGPHELHRLINELGDDDGVVGSRWLPGSNVVVKQTLTRRLASRGFNLLVRVLFGLPFKDTQCGAKVFRKPAIDDVLPELHTTDFAFDVELLHRLNRKGYRVREVPTTWEDQDGSTLRVRRAVPRMFLSVIRLRILDSRFRWFARKRIWSYVYRKIK